MSKARSALLAITRTGVDLAWHVYTTVEQPARGANFGGVLRHRGDGEGYGNCRSHGARHTANVNAVANHVRVSSISELAASEVTMLTPACLKGRR